MNPRGPQLLVTLVFGATLLSAGALQLGIELCRGVKPQMLELFARAPGTDQLRAYEERLESESWLADRLRPWMQDAQFILLNDLGEKAVRGRHNWLFYRPGIDCLTQRMPVDPNSVDPVVAICDFRDQLANRGIHLVVVPAPNKESIYPGQLTRRAVSLPIAVGELTRSVLHRLQNANVDVVDLFELYGRNKSDPNDEPASSLYLVQDSHWSPAGVELAARAVAERLLDRGWIGHGNTEYAAQAAPTERVGDVLRMLDVPQIEARFEPELLFCRQVVEATTTRPYRDAPSSEVLVIGDSFLRVYQQDNPGAAGFVAHLARELKQPIASLISDGGASTLVRQELCRRPALLANKRVVVWEFVERDIRLGLEGWQKVPLPDREAVARLAGSVPVVDAEDRPTAVPGETTNPQTHESIKK